VDLSSDFAEKTGKHVKRRNVKVVQELMCHARRTLEVYSQAKIMAKREAQQRIVQMILSGQASGCEITLLQMDWQIVHATLLDLSLYR